LRQSIELRFFTRVIRLLQCLLLLTRISGDRAESLAVVDGAPAFREPIVRNRASAHVGHTPAISEHHVRKLAAIHGPAFMADHGALRIAFETADAELLILCSLLLFTLGARGIQFRLMRVIRFRTDVITDHRRLVAL